ncbi:hypothetical protein BD408DRAFT_421520 [Parasitella parasitica]|nr:hypothetical protein BD408DRAFT_421520 [Parasitella parasitica]
MVVILLAANDYLFNDVHTFTLVLFSIDQASMNLKRLNPISRTNRSNSKTRQICH